METTTYVVQRHGREASWTDCGEFDTEPEARDLCATFEEKLAPVLGPFRIVRRTEEVI